MIKGLLRLFIERIVVEANRIRIIGKTGMVLALFEQKTAARRFDILAAGKFWLPSHACGVIFAALQHKYS